MIRIEYTATLEPMNTKSVMMYCERSGDDCITGLVLADKDGTDRGVVHFTLPEYADLAATVIDMEKAVDPVFTLLYVKLGNEAEQPDPALTDGAGKQAAEDLTIGEADLVSEADINMLLLMSSGTLLLMGNSYLSRFRNRGWVAVTEETGSKPTASREYGITEEGRRALLDAQTSEAEPPREETKETEWSPAILALLRMMACGTHVWDTHPLWEALRVDELIGHIVEGKADYYAITAKGRRVLAEQEG